MKKLTILLSSFLCAFSLKAQFDTTFGTGTFHFVDTVRAKSFPNITATYKAVAIDDTLFGTTYIGVSNSNGEIPFKLPTYYKITIGLDELGNAANCLFYPNPASEINVMLPKTGNYKLQILDIHGAVVLEKSERETDHMYLSLAALPNAAYVALVIDLDNSFTATQKIVKADTEQYGAIRLNTVNTGFGKVAGTGADYQLIYTPPLGYVKDTVIINLQDGNNGIVPIYVNKLPIDTTFGTATLRLVKGNQNPTVNYVPNASIEIMGLNLTDFTPTTAYTATTDSLGQTTVTLPVHLDTMQVHTTNVMATYGVYPPRYFGYYRDTLSFSLNDGQNGVIDIAYNPWDTIFNNDFISIGLYDSTATGSGILHPIYQNTIRIYSDTVGDLIIDTLYPTRAFAFPPWDTLPQFSRLIMEIDTNHLTMPVPTVKLRVAWKTKYHILDSNKVNMPNYVGVYGDSVTISVYDTIASQKNQGIFIHASQIPRDPLIGKERILIKTGQFDKDFNRTVADSALVVFYNQTNGTTDSVWTNANGIAQSPRYSHNNQIFVGAGFVGGYGSNGEALKMVKGVPVTMQGVSYNRLVAGDTLQELLFNFLPDSVNVNALGVTEGITASELKQMHEEPSVAMQLDTIKRYINPTNFTQLQLANIQNVIDSANQIFPIYVATSTTPFPNPVYNGTNYTTSNFGINIAQGSNNIANEQRKPSNVIGENLDLVTASVLISGATTSTWKEIFYQYFAFAGVPASQRLSVTNGTASLPTTWDYANFILKYHFEHEMFKGTTPASTGTPTQNISVNYYYDDNNITAQ